MWRCAQDGRNFTFYGIGVTFVSQGIDTLDKMGRQLVTLNGMMDEQFLVGLADKVHRGQEGRVLKGLTRGARHTATSTYRSLTRPAR